MFEYARNTFQYWYHSDEPPTRNIQDSDYLAIVEDFATNLDSLNEAFSNAWYKLTTRDMGPYSRCAGTDVPPPQEFQLHLPSPSPAPHGDYWEAKEAIEDIVLSEDPTIEPDTFNGQSSYAALFVTLAFQCASTFRSTDYMGGCNGARIRFSPQKDWASNVGLDLVSIPMCVHIVGEGALDAGAHFRVVGAHEHELMI